MLSLESCVVKNEKIPWRIIEEEGVLVDVGKGEVIHLNKVAASIWGIIDGKKTVGEIIAEIRKEYEVDKQSAESDVISFLDKLSEKGVVECQE